ncbi:MAG: response regulator transcription factor [Bacillota bacterium]
MSKNNVLVVDDEENICDLVTTYLKEDFIVTKVHDGKRALYKFRHQQFDLIILDLMLPELNGWDFCKEVRKHSNIPIIMLTAKDNDLDKLLGLELGADDYITKPFNPRELVARTKAVMRRFKQSEESEVIQYPGISINKSSFEVQVNAENLELTPKEFDLLWIFASNPSLVFRREQLLRKVWSYDYLGDSRAVDNTIKRLRRKLESIAGAPIYIKTVWGVGYKFEVPTI